MRVPPSLTLDNGAPFSPNCFPSISIFIAQAEAGDKGKYNGVRMGVMKIKIFKPEGGRGLVGWDGERRGRN